MRQITLQRALQRLAILVLILSGLIMIGSATAGFVIFMNDRTGDALVALLPNRAAIFLAIASLLTIDLIALVSYQILSDEK